MLTFNDFSSLFDLLNSGVRYWVYGGLALDGLRGEITREHKDLDLYIDEEDKVRLESALHQGGWSVRVKDRMMYPEKGTLKVGVLFLKKGEVHSQLNGNRTTTYFPTMLLRRDHYCRVRAVAFCVAPFELLKFESRYSAHQADREFAANLPVDQKLFEQIRDEPVLGKVPP